VLVTWVKQMVSYRRLDPTLPPTPTCSSRG
jgi:hypothetical protein